MGIKKFLLILILIFESYILVAQPPDSKKFLPVIAPPSPEASAFAKYGNYEVNLFTGIPDISIPLYEIKIGELSVPISLKYHSSGIKVSEMPSRIGLGWDLQAGGSITRKIQGHPDEFPGNYLYATSTSESRVKLQSEINPLTEAGLHYLDRVEKGLFDVEPDIFSYNFPGHGGKFLFNQKDNFNPVLIPYAPIQVNQSHSPSQLALGIVDESGIKYQFDTTEWTSTGGGISVYCLSAWLLSDMISANKQDSIHFKYISSGFGMTDSYYSDFLVLDDNITGDYTGTQQGSFYTSAGSVATDGQQLTEINFKNGKVVFEAAPESRQDFASGFLIQNRLNAIKIYSYDAINYNYVLVKSYIFFHSYFINGTDNTTKRLKLDSIQLKTNTGSVDQTFKFNYNTNTSLPAYGSRMKDYWGYFNNINNVQPAPNSSPTSIPKMQVQYAAPYTAPVTIWIGGDRTDARDPDPNYMQAYILQKITFPTGGNTQFEYETNKYLDEQSNQKYAGGLRIKSIKSYADNAATPIIKTYKYGVNESGFGRNNFLLEDHFFMSVQNFRKKRELMPNGLCADNPNSKTTRTYFANPRNDLESFDGAPVVYPFVTEYLGDGANNAGKTTYEFSDRPDAKTSIVGYGKPMLTSYHYVRGLLTVKSDYRRNADDSYSLVAANRKKYQYFPFQNTSGGLGLVVFKSDIFEGFNGLNFFTGCEGGTDSYSYKFNNYEMVSGDNKLVIDTSITYDQNDISRAISTITNYTYDDLIHLQVTQSQTKNSRGQTLSTTYTYPYNYATAPYTNMTANHIFNKVVTETKTNGSPLSVLTNNYASFSGSNFLPENIQLKIQSNTAETRAAFNQYDNRGNILEMQKTSDVKQSIIWDYQYLQPVAVVTNASQTDIAYCSFEADGKGNWAFTGRPNIDPSAPTGNRIYNLLPAKPLTKTGLTSAKSYILSYWTKNAVAFTIPGTQSGFPIAGRSVSLWNYFEHKITGVTTVTLSGSGTIDEVRLYPAVNVQMITNTYKPLIGVTSQCDANNRITYYEYDGLGRLILIRDQDKKIIKQIYYNYTGQPEKPNIVYNMPQSDFFTKTGCTSCLAATSLLYNVPSAMFSAPTQELANQMAIDYVAANGQAYADSNSICETPVSAAITGTNAMTQTYTIRFQSTTCVTFDYTFSLVPGMSNSGIGSVPAGNYTVTFSPPNSNAYRCRVNSITLFKSSGGSGVITTNIYASGASVGITP